MDRQRGMAVISALLVAALVAVIAAGLLARQARLMRLAEGEGERQAAQWVARSATAFGLRRLRQAWQQDPATRLDQGWARGWQLPVTDSAAFDGRLLDEQGLFNLASLVHEGQLDPLEQAAFQRLGASLGVAPATLAALEQRLLAAYGEARLPRPRSLEDLANVPGGEPRALARLAPFVTVLPLPGWVNGNTAPAEVIAARVPGLGLERARALVAERDRGQGFINSGDLLNRLRLPQLDTEQVRLGITSEWFRLQGQVRVGSRQWPLEALLFRPEDGAARVVWSRVGA